MNHVNQMIDHDLPPLEGPSTRPILIVRLKAPDVDKDYFAVVLEGLQIEDETELRALGFFSELQQRTNLKFDVGSWEDIEAHQLPDLIQTIDKLHPGSTTGELGNLLAALRKMAVTAQEEGCFLSFML